MTGKQLRNSILQWAIQGKLVPQDPNDEPASVLLERIRAEKARLVKEKKIKRDKNETIIYRGEDNSYYEKTLATGAVRCIDDEIPFDIPESWMWVRFGNLSFNRDSERIPLSVSERSNLNKIYDYYGASGVIDKVDRYLFDKPLLLIGEDGANLINRSTPIAFIAMGRYWVNNHAHVIDFISYDLMRYVSNFINAISLVDYITGTAQPKMNQEKMNSILIAVPPIQEQVRINDRIISISSIVEKYEKQRTLLDQLNNTIEDKLNKSILQEAIQGKLVPQIKSEGTAEGLLEEIRAEKKRLVKEGKLKKSAIANESRIFRGDDNKYYEQIGKQIIEIEPLFNIPDSWSWVRLPQIAISELGKTLDKGKDSGEVTPYLCSINVYWTGIAMNTVKKARFSQSERCKYKLQSGDLLICEGGDVGRCSIWTSNIDMWYQNALHRVRPFTGINVYYLKSLIEHYKGIGIIDKICKGVTIKHFTQSALCSLLIPLPPYKEQCRIIQYLSLYDKI